MIAPRPRETESLNEGVEEMEINPVFKLALGAVLTAGYRPGSELKHKLQRRCFFDVARAYDSGDGFDGVRRYIESRAIEALKETGYPVAEKPQGLDLLRPLIAAPEHKAPQAGDIVRAAQPWSLCEEFALQGVLGEPRRGFTIANRRGGWHVGTDPERRNAASMGNGGPASIGYLDARKLKETGETARLFAWDFAFTPAAHTGVEFLIPVRVWDWSGDPADFIGWEEAEELESVA